MNDSLESLRLIKIGVLMGGCSSEREISLKSGAAVYKALKQLGYRVCVIDLFCPEEKKILEQLKESKIDIAFLALHGQWGEDGRIQEILEKCRIPYTGSGVEASRIAINKVLTYKKLQESGIRTPRYIAVQKEQKWDQDGFLIQESFPVIVKPSCEGSSIGITLVESKDQLSKAIKRAFEHDQEILIEQYIHGKELTVGILGNKLLPVVEIRPHRSFFDFESKYQVGMTDYIVPAEINPETATLVQNLALRVHESLGCRHLSRVDFILTPQSIPYVLEINTIPGMTETSLLPKAALSIGIDFIQLCSTLLHLSYAENK